ncbi:glycosyl transferase family 39 [Acidovorax delafieldii 2AN]|uniref:Glycosyl transferase family 39 n=1 Tax=Acidovorax delafieldii 2AN TaxID=573060 RepID=C5T5S0_ACIDE|nr:glycosyltransferase family 39 protein [Acidovorax delafieldii]EER60181.1 glycosyl transferase family 39 [Acidovorax delafieldii 2AN]
MTNSKRAWLAMGALWLLLLVLAALRPLSLPDEGRYAEISRWMLVSGDWLTPRLDGIPFFHKPPLLHWLGSLSLATFGVNAWAARLVPALHAGLMLVLVYVTASRVSTPAVARRAAVMLGTSLAFLGAGQYVNHDMLVAAWIGVAIWSFALAFLHGDRPHAGWARLGFAACALGVLSKGLIGLALPGLVLLIWLLWTRQFAKVLRLPWFSGLALFGLMALPWFVLAQRHYPDFFSYLFGVQQFGRYTGTTFNNPRPWWFYLPALAGLFFPWIVFVANQVKVPVHSAQGASDSIARPVWLLCWIWIVAIVGFFSIPASKIVGYVLPVLPPLALLAAVGWQQWLGRHARERAVFGMLALCAVVGAIVLNEVAARHSARQGTADIAFTLACQAGTADTVYAVGEYPYDLPFYTQAVQPMVVVQDWPALRRAAGDNWRRELFEGADFEAAAGRVLQTPDVLVTALRRPGQWLVAPNAMPAGQIPAGWVQVQRGAGWSLWRSAPERPEAAEHKGLPGCQHQGGEQGRQ